MTRTVVINRPVTRIIEISRGLTGADGAQGSQGIQGEQGPQGLQGIQGPQGDSFDPAAANTVTGEMTFVVTPGESFRVVDDVDNPTFIFGLENDKLLPGAVVAGIYFPASGERLGYDRFANGVRRFIVGMANDNGTASLSLQLNPDGTSVSTIEALANGRAGSITLADLLTNYPANSYQGYQFRVSDCNNSWWESDGTHWKPLNGQCVLALDNVPYGLGSGRTISTGSSGHCVFTVAFPVTYSLGAWIYFRNASTASPALTAGMYWCVFSDASTCTIYTNGPGSAAFNFTVGEVVAGSTAEITVRSVPLPANLFTRGQLALSGMVRMLSSANTKTVRVKIGTTPLGLAQPPNTASLGLEHTIYADSATAQKAWRATDSGSGSAPYIGTEDMTAANTYLITLQKATANEYVVLEGFRLEFYS